MLSANSRASSPSNVQNSGPTVAPDHESAFRSYAIVVSWQKNFLPSTSTACVMGEKFRMAFRSPDW